MKNLYIRAGMAPFENLDPYHVLLHNSISGNSGNLLYAYGLCRAIMTENTNIEVDHYTTSSSDMPDINKKYDAWIIPLADAFRNNFMEVMDKLTKCIRKSRIPVILVGVGLRAPLETDLSSSFPFDDHVKKFVSSILDKSAVIGVRGETTGRYLTKLGFREGSHYKVIGCPSMYGFGDTLKIREPQINKGSLISLNSSIFSEQKTIDFVERVRQQFPNHYFVPQHRRELALTLLGDPYPHSSNIYPDKATDPIYREGRVRFFINVPGWLEYMKNADLSVGPRLHGNIAAMVSGTPSIMIVKDGRMRELAEYHGFSCVYQKDINENTCLEDLIGKVDFHSVEKQQKKNFDNYISFLEANGLDHIYKNGTPKEAPLDKKVKEIDHFPAVTPISACSLEEMTERWNTYFPAARRYQENLQKEYKQAYKYSMERFKRFYKSKLKR
ncbi:MAG: polysaccharide pyruvyl transferase family protein [Clostridiales bacterium]|nr:polysaccharide pyruvyl transferase family protein [Clostridiales bacterium]